MRTLKELKEETIIINNYFNASLQALKINNARLIVRLYNNGIRSGANELIWSTGSVTEIELGDCFLIKTKRGLRLCNEYCEDVAPEDMMERMKWPEELLFCPEFFKLCRPNK